MSEKMKHTAGSWKVNRTLYYTFILPVDDSREGQVICEMPGDAEEERANAQLIAAAPELLEALEAHLNPMFNSMDAHKMMLKAIAKATGAE